MNLELGITRISSSSGYAENNLRSFPLNVSMGFTNGQGVLFSIKALKGKDLRLFYVFPDEEEILVIPNSKFFVSSGATQDPDNPGVWVIEMVEIDDQIPFFA